MNEFKDSNEKETVSLGIKARSMAFPKLFSRPFKRNNTTVSNITPTLTPKPDSSIMNQSLSSPSSSSVSSSSSYQEFHGILHDI